MREVGVHQLKAGILVRTPLLHRSGVPLVAPGQTLTRQVLDALRDASEATVYIVEPGERVEDARRQLVLAPVEVSDFTAGETLDESVYDREGRLLLEQGTSIPPSFAESLARRGIRRIFCRRPERELGLDTGRKLRERIETALSAAKSVTGEMEALEALPLKLAAPEEVTEDRVAYAIDQAESLNVVPTGDTLTKELRDSNRLVMESAEEKSTFVELYQDALTQTRDLFQRLQAGGKVEAGVVRRVAAQTVAGLIRNRELLMASAAITLPGTYLISHSVAVATIAINIACALGYSKAQVLAIGHGALLHDVGMLRVPPNLLTKTARLTNREWQEIWRHPAYGLDMLQRIAGIPEEVPFVVYQSHERNNGSGYPRGKRGKVIHTYARIVAVADVYNSICSARPYRPARTPYEAMEQLVLMCGQHKLDAKIVRAFLRCNSMFPVGSWVELTSADRARVVAATGEDYMRPVVSVVFDEQGRRVGAPRRVDLTQEPSLAVAKALTDEEIGEYATMDGF